MASTYTAQNYLYHKVTEPTRPPFHLRNPNTCRSRPAIRAGSGRECVWVVVVIYCSILTQPVGTVQELFKIGFGCDYSKDSSSSLSFCSSTLKRSFQDTMRELKQQHYWNLDFRSSELSLPGNIYHSMMNVCVAVEGGEGGRIRAVIADVENEALSGLLLVTNHFKIPVISIKPRSTVLDPMLSEFYLSVFPSRSTSTKLIVAFLKRYALTEVGIVANNLYLSSNYYSLSLNRSLTSDPKLSVDWLLHYDPDQVGALDVISRFRDSSRVSAILVLLPLSNMISFFTILSTYGTEINNYIWIFPDISHTEDPDIIRLLPTGSISFYSALRDDPTEVAGKLTEVIMKAAEAVKVNQGTDLGPDSVREINSLTCLRDQNIGIHVKQGSELLQLLKKSIFTTSSGNKYYFDKDGFNGNGYYKVVNLVPNPSVGFDSASTKVWKSIGSYQPEDGGLKLNTIIWPGGSPLLPDAVRIADTENIRLVLKLSLPFVMQTAQYSEESEDAGTKCTDVGIQCINVTDFTTDPWIIQEYLDGDREGSVLCCYGFTVEVLKSLASDLNLNYQAFLTPEATVGSYSDGKWHGMIGDILRDSADMAAGATSITPQRAEAIQFSVPYYSSAFGTLSARKPPRPATSAFMDPFSPSMWVLIFIFVHVTAIFMAFFEWLSPYGLHPNGRNRRSVFSFPSGLLHTWSLLFSHTYASKPPKSVASRIIVNAWGMFAVVFIAGYTANLASFMAGRMLDPNIDISKLRYPDSDMKFATINGTSTEYYLQLYFPQRYREFKKNNVKSLAEGVAKLKNYEIGALMFDAPQVEYEAATDPECTLIAAGSNFWSDTYGLMFPKHSNLVNQINERLVNYEATGMITTWEKKWLTTPNGECYSPMMSRYRLSFDHAHGVFILIMVGSLFSFLVLGLEWLVYKLVVPCLKQHEYSGKWKYILFFSQRLNASLRTAPRIQKKKHSIISLVDAVHSSIRSKNSSPNKPNSKHSLLKSTTGSFKVKKPDKENQSMAKPNVTPNPVFDQYHQLSMRSNNLSATPGNSSKMKPTSAVKKGHHWDGSKSKIPYTVNEVPSPILPYKELSMQGKKDTLSDSSMFDSNSSLLMMPVRNQTTPVAGNSGQYSILGNVTPGSSFAEPQDNPLKFPIIVKSPGGGHVVSVPGEFKTGIEIVETRVPNGYMSNSSSRNLSPFQTADVTPVTVKVPMQRADCATSKLPKLRRSVDTDSRSCSTDI